MTPRSLPLELTGPHGPGAGLSGLPRPASTPQPASTWVLTGLDDWEQPEGQRREGERGGLGGPGPPGCWLGSIVMGEGARRPILLHPLGAEQGALPGAEVCPFWGSGGVLEGGVWACGSSEGQQRAGVLPEEPERGRTPLRRQTVQDEPLCFWFGTGSIVSSSSSLPFPSLLWPLGIWILPRTRCFMPVQVSGGRAFLTKEQQGQRP